jgi:16S rRNA (cytosine967-C5)-methyltransferase
LAETGDIAGLAARRAAAGLVAAVTAQGRPLDAAAEAAEGPLAGLPPAGRARALRLAAQVLRQAGRLDARLAPFLAKPPPAAVLWVLRLAALELAEGEAPHGVVNAAVALLGETGRTARHAGLANAVLRRLAEVPPAPLTRQPPPRLPPWLRGPLVAAWGGAAVGRIEGVQAGDPPLDLTPNPARPVPPPAGAEVLPTGGWRLADPGQVSALPGHAEGGFWVQDAAAALAVPLLAPQPGERVIDLCAAPGGKTLQLAAAGARVTAVDLSAPRLERLAANLSRCGLAAEVVVADARDWAPAVPADAVLLDAPCSATGTIRRHPDLPWLRRDAGLPALVALQAALIDRALGFLRPGGRLVFCTCSLLPSEGEAQLAAALARHPSLVVERPALPGLDPAWITRAGAIRTRPDYWAARGGIDGFFIVRLRAGGGVPT